VVIKPYGYIRKVIRQENHITPLLPAPIPSPCTQVWAQENPFYTISRMKGRLGRTIRALATPEWVSS